GGRGAGRGQAAGGRWPAAGRGGRPARYSRVNRTPVPSVTNGAGRVVVGLLSIQGRGRPALVRRSFAAPGVIMESWIAWLVLAALLGLAEIMTTTLAFGLLAVAAAVAAVVGGLGLALPFQLGAFVLAAGGGLGIVRALSGGHIPQPPPLETGASAPVGRAARLTQGGTAPDGRGRHGGRGPAAPPF